MLKNHLTITLRRLSRQKGYTFLNVMGLALGLAVFGILMLFVRYEMSYERFHEKADRIGVLIAESGPDENRTAVNVHGLTYGKTIAESVPEVEHVIQVLGSGMSNVLVDGQVTPLIEIRGAYVDSAVFEVFTFPLIVGDPTTALRNTQMAVVDRKAAIQLYGTDDPNEVIGRTFEHDNFLFEVTGLMENVPPTTTWRPNVLLSLETRFANPDRMIMSGFPLFRTYVLYGTSDTPSDVLQKAVAALPQGQVHQDELTLRSQPISKIHLHGYDIFQGETHTSSGPSAGGLMVTRSSAAGPQSGNITRLRIFGLVAVLILLLATVNYVNLATAYGMQRTREIGVRKTHGANRSQVFTQFLAESVLLALTSGLLAGFIISLAIPYFNDAVGVELSFGWAPAFVAVLTIIALLVGILAGLYPATTLSGAHPTTAFRSGYDGEKGGKRLRELLVVFQFTVGIALVITSIVMVRQIGYMQSAPLGIAPTQVIDLNVRPRLGHQVPEQQLLDRLQRETAIQNVKRMVIGWGGVNATYVHPEDPDSTHVGVMIFIMDPAAPQLLGMELMAGNWLANESEISEVESTDMPDPYSIRHLLINETAARERGWTTEEAVGRSYPTEGTDAFGLITGVVRDFYYHSMREPIGSMAIQVAHEIERSGSLLIHFAEGNDQAAMDAVRAAWEDVVPDLPLSAEFLADRYHNFYGPERRLAGLFWAFGIIAVVIACLGLFGLAAFTAERRVREVGIRKVVGADTSSIVKLLSRDFALLVVIAFVIAAPIAWWAMSRWLDDFAYHITLGPGIFLLAGFGALLVALATVSWHAFRAANADPVKSLRSE